MADGVTLPTKGTTGSTAPIVESTDKGALGYRQVMSLGACGPSASQTDITAGSKTSANSIPVVIASDQASVAMKMSTTPTIANGSGVVNAPSSESLAGIASVVSTAAESSHVLKSGAGNLYGLTVSIGATTGYVMIFNATSAPVDGAVTPTWPPVRVVSDGISGWISIGFDPPLYCSTGITAVFSSTGPFTKTASATAVFGGQVS